VRLYSRPWQHLTDRFPLIIEALAKLRSRSCIIDGEAVCCGGDGVRASWSRELPRRDSTCTRTRRNASASSMTSPAVSIRSHGCAGAPDAHSAGSRSIRATFNCAKVRSFSGVSATRSGCIVRCRRARELARVRSPMTPKGAGTSTAQLRSLRAYVCQGLGDGLATSASTSALRTLRRYRAARRCRCRSSTGGARNGSPLYNAPARLSVLEQFTPR
jgi:hypothetical protein